MEKICHITSVHPVKDMRIWGKECASLSNAGYDVYLIAQCTINQVIDNVKIIGLPPKETNRFKRFLNSTRNILDKALLIDASVYHLHDPELIPLGIKLKKKGKVVIFDSHEDVPSQILDKAWIPQVFRRIVSFVYSQYEKKQLKKFDALVSVTTTLTERLKKINPKTFQITNYPIIESNEVIVRKWQRSVCFAGGISPQWLHENVIQALGQTANIKYELAGLIDEKYYGMISSLDAWNKVNFIGKIPHAEVLSFLSKSTIGIALNCYCANVGYKMGSIGNTKLFEYMQAGIPVVCTDFILWKKIIETEKCGICVNPYDIDAIAKAIQFIIDNPDVAKKMGDNGKKAVQREYNWNTQEVILLDMYNQLTTD